MSALGGVTVVDVLALLFSEVGSDVVVLTVAVLLKTVPGEVALGMCPTRVKTLVVLAGILAIVQFTVPPEPGEGVVQFQIGPESWVRDTKVMVLGSGSFKVALSALSGPLLITVTV